MIQDIIKQRLAFLEPSHISLKDLIPEKIHALSIKADLP